MKLIVGLGNPGPEYTGTRHNIGFAVVEEFALRHRLSFDDAPFAWVAEGTVLGQEVVLLKPNTFMNRSGRAVSWALGHYPAEPADLLIIYDDMDLELGRIRIRPRGGSGGHKGLASVLQAIGHEDVPRLRLGIGRPQPGMEGRDYVLSPFAAGEEDRVKDVLHRAVEALETYLQRGIDAAMNEYNSTA